MHRVVGVKKGIYLGADVVRDKSIVKTKDQIDTKGLRRGKVATTEAWVKTR